MAETTINLQFELSTGNIYAGQDVIELIEAGQTPRNLVQLRAMGRLLVGDVAIFEQAPDSSGDTDIVPLPELLLDRQYYRTRAADYEGLDVSEWTRDDYIEYGRWLDSITKNPDQTISELSQPVLRQANRLGIGPSIGNIGHADEERFKPVSAYFVALDVLPRYKAYDSWSDQNFADYAERVFLELLEETGERTGYVPLNDVIDRRAKLGDGPSCEIFRSHGGWPMKFMALKGYADIKSMEPEDYVKWGVRFMLANDGKLPNRDAINFLARTRRVPAADSFLSRFRWAVYLAKTTEAYKQQQAVALRQRLPDIQQEIEDNRLPRCIIRDASAQEIVTVRAKWLLVNELFPQLAAAHKRLIAQYVGPTKLRVVLRDTGEVDDFDIKEAAAKVGVVEDLWPALKEPYLRVPEELLA